MGLLDHYRLTRKLGQNPLGDTWRGEVKFGADRRRPVLIRRVDLERAPTHLPRRIVEEAQRAQMGANPVVARIEEFGRHGRYVVLVVEWIDGHSLAALVERCRLLGQSLPLRIGAHLLLESARAVAALHEFRGPDGDAAPVPYVELSSRRVLVAGGRVRLADQVIDLATLRDHLDDSGELDPLDEQEDLRRLSRLAGELIERAALRTSPARFAGRLDSLLDRLDRVGRSGGMTSARGVVRALEALMDSEEMAEMQRRVEVFVGVVFGDRKPAPGGARQAPTPPGPKAAGGSAAPGSAAREGSEESAPTVENRRATRRRALDGAAPEGDEAIPMGHFLQVVRRGRVEEIVLFGEGRVSVGTAADNDIVSDARDVKPHHAHFAVQGNDVIVVDLSGGSTKVEGRAIVERRLVPGETVEIGELELIFDPPPELLLAAAEGVQLEAAASRPSPGTGVPPAGSRVDPHAIVPTRVLGMRPWGALRRQQGAEVLDYPIRGLLSCIGSDFGNDVVIQGPGIHPRHAILRVGPTGAILLRRAHPKAVLRHNGVDVAVDCRLRSGDRIGVGGVEFVFLRHPPRRG